MVQTPFRFRSHPFSVWWSAVALVTVIGAVVRIAGIHGGLWRDEAQSAALAAEPSLAAMLRALAVRESHPPLYLLLLRGWTTLFGAGDVGVVSFSVVMGVLQIPMAAVLARRIGGNGAGLLAAALVAVSGPLVRYSVQARPYSLLPLLALAALTLSSGILRGNGNRRGAAGLGLVVGAMALTHHVGALLGALWLLALLLVAPEAWRRIAWAAATAALVWSPWAPIAVAQTRHGGHGAIPVELLPLGQFGPFAAKACAVGLLLAGALVLVVAYRFGRWADGRHRMAIAALAAGAAGYLLLNGLAPWFDLRHQRVALPCRVWWIVGAAGFAGLGWRNRPWAALVAALAAALVAAPQSLPTTLARFRTNVPEVVARIRPHVRPDDRVLVAPQTLAPSVYRYLDPAAAVAIGWPEVGARRWVSYADVAAAYRDPVSYRRLRRQVAAERTLGHRIWLIAPAGLEFGGWSELEDALPPIPRLFDNTSVRAAQILRLLTVEYGDVRRFGAPPRRWDQDEAVEALLFSPEGP